LAVVLVSVSVLMLKVLASVPRQECSSARGGCLGLDYLLLFFLFLHVESMQNHYQKNVFRGIKKAADLEFVVFDVCV